MESALELGDRHVGARRRLVGPFGRRAAQALVRVRRPPDGCVARAQLAAYRFVVDPIGEHSPA